METNHAGEHVDAESFENNKRPKISRRKLLASLGLIGATAVVTQGLSLTRFVGTAEAAQDEIPVKFVTLGGLRSTRHPQNVLYYVQDAGREGFFRYVSQDNTSLDNDGTIVVSVSGARFKRIYDGFINARWFGAKGDGVSDDTTAIQKAINTLSKLKNNRDAQGGGVIFLPKGIYRITDTIYLDKFVKLQGELARGGFYFNFDPHPDKVSGTVIYADFTTPDKICIDASGIVAATGQRVGPKQVISAADIDNMLISSVHGVSVEDLVVYTDKTVYCGIRYCGTPNSKIRNVHSKGFEVGILLNTGWGCSLEHLFINAKYHGFAAVNSAIGCSVVNPYIDTTAYNDLIPTDRIPPYVYSYEEGDIGINPTGLKRKRVCVYNIYCDSITYTAPIMENANIGLVGYHSTITLLGPHIEQLMDYAIFAVTSSVKSTNLQFYGPGLPIIYSGVNAEIDFEHISGTFGTYFAYVSEWSQSNLIKDILSDSTLYYPYVKYTHINKGITANDIFVDPVYGDDARLGFSANNAVQTLDAAVIRIDKSKKNVIWIKGGTTAVANVFSPRIENCDVEIRSFATGKGKIVSKLDGINNGLTLIHSNVYLYGVDIEVEAGSYDSSFRSMFYATGNCGVGLTDAIVTLNSNTSIIQPYYGQSANITANYENCEFLNPGGGGAIGGSVYNDNGKVCVVDSSIGNTVASSLVNNKYESPVFQVIMSSL